MSTDGQAGRVRTIVGWAAAGAGGVVAGVLGGVAYGGAGTAGAVATQVAPTIPLWLVAPFALLLLTIAVAPLLAPRWWHHFFPHVSLALGGLVGGFYGAAYGGYGVGTLQHAGLEYFSFVALVVGLFVVTGTIFVELPSKPGPFSNAGILLVGALLANVVGTTGASMLLIRPFMRINKGRLRPLHVVFFILIVSNCGGCLTPIGDPPLYLGYLSGVPFSWPLLHLWESWLMVNLVLVGACFGVDVLFDRNLPSEQPPPGAKFRIVGGVNFVWLGLLIGAIFIPHPWGPLVQVACAFGAYRTASKAALASNEFTFFPAKEVALLFLGIFLTMMPALGYLAQNGAKLGIDSPTTFYFATGVLSAVLDNAPTYLNFLQVAVPGELSRASVAALLASPAGVANLEAISLGAVLFGALTYIGNGPNFMVRSVAEAGGVKMPSFFLYAAMAGAILLPVLVLNWAVFVR